MDDLQIESGSSGRTHTSENVTCSEPSLVFIWYCGHVVALAFFALADEAPDEAPDADAAAEEPDSARAEAAVDAPDRLAQLVDPTERAHAYAGCSKSEATIRAYAAGWHDFLSFCEHRDAIALPASDQTVAALAAAYLADMADRCARAATIARRMVVI
jgi:hypothetical protein